MSSPHQLCPEQLYSSTHWQSHIVFVYSLPQAAASFSSPSAQEGTGCINLLCFAVCFKYCAFCFLAPLCLVEGVVFLIFCLGTLPAPQPLCLGAFPGTWGLPCFPETSGLTYPIIL